MSTGFHQLDLVLTALAFESAPRPLRKLCLNQVHWSCFDRDAEELMCLFKPLAALERLDLIIDDGRFLAESEKEDERNEDCKKFSKYLGHIFYSGAT